MNRLCDELERAFAAGGRLTVLRGELRLLADGRSLAPVDLLHSAFLTEDVLATILKPDVDLLSG